LRMFLLLFLSLSFSLKIDPKYSPTDYFDVQSGVRCTGDILGEQGATSMEDCEYNCWVVPGCTWATWDFGGQCSWGSNCVLSNYTTANVGTRKKENQLLNFYWAGGTIYRNILKTETTTLQNAITTCTNMANCTSFGFDSKTHLPTDNVFVSYLDYDQIIDADALVESWTYYKNATVTPFCDPIVDPTFAPNNQEIEITMTYGHCQSGSDIVATLYNSKRGVVSNTTLTNGSGNSKLKTTITTEVNTMWNLEIASEPGFKISVPIQIVGGVCPKDGAWDTQVAGKSTAMTCWEVSSNYTTGSASRECTADGWKDPDLHACSRGNWNELQVGYLNLEQKDMFYPDDDHKRMWPSFSYYSFYWPGDKIYGMQFGKFQGDCENNGFTDIPGSMVDTTYRRMILGWGGKMPDNTCNNWNQTFLISISELSGQQWINNWITVVHENGIYKSVTSDSEKLILNYSVEPYHEFQVLRVEMTDSTEDTCFWKLDELCHDTLGDEKNCLLCALEDNKSTLKEAECDQENNWEEVIGFWCKCTDINDCAGTPPQHPNFRWNNKNQRKIYGGERLN